jgi:hypothetical protein
MLFECRDEQEKSFIDYNNRYENECYYSNKNIEDEYFKKYTLTGLSHETYKNSGKCSDGEMYEEFIDIVESQTKYNTENTIGAIFILIYHSVDYSHDDYSISPDLFKKEMEYLYENGYEIFQMKDIIYDNELHIRGY